MKKLLGMLGLVALALALSTSVAFAKENKDSGRHEGDRSGEHRSDRGDSRGDRNESRFSMVDNDGDWDMSGR